MVAVCLLCAFTGAAFAAWDADVVAKHSEAQTKGLKAKADGNDALKAEARAAKMEAFRIFRAAVDDKAVGNDAIAKVIADVEGDAIGPYHHHAAYLRIFPPHSDRSLLNKYRARCVAELKKGDHKFAMELLHLYGADLTDEELPLLMAAEYRIDQRRLKMLCSLFTPATRPAIGIAAITAIPPDKLASFALDAEGNTAVEWLVKANASEKLSDDAAIEGLGRIIKKLNADASLKDQVQAVYNRLATIELTRRAAQK